MQRCRRNQSRLLTGKEPELWLEKPHSGGLLENPLQHHGTASVNADADKPIKTPKKMEKYYLESRGSRGPNMSKNVEIEKIVMADYLDRIGEG